MTSAKRPVSGFPLLPSPERDYITMGETQPEPSPEQLFPPNFKEIVATAAFDYAAELNLKNRSRGGQAILKLNPEDQQTAVGVILDAIKLAQLAEGQTDLSVKPRELRRTIKTGLGLRETERLTAKRLVDDLKQVLTTNGKKPVFYDLGLDERLVAAARQEVSNYPITPQPENARQLMTIVPARRQAVQQMAVIAAATYMAEHQGDLSETIPDDEFIELNLGFVSELLNTANKQAPVDRGELAAATVHLIKRGKKLNPTFFKPNDLKLVTQAFGDPKIANKTTELAIQSAEKLLAHSPELIPTGSAALEVFGGQIRQAVILAEKVTFSRGDDRIGVLTALDEIFSILPTQPMLRSGGLITKAELLSTADSATRHLWEDAIKMPAGPNRSVFIPDPATLISAKALLNSIQVSSDNPIDHDRDRLSRAIKAWRLRESEKTTLPGKIEKLGEKIKALAKSFDTNSLNSAEIKDLHPIQLDAKILARSGTISVLSRRIHQAESALATHRRLSIVSESTAPDQFAVRYLTYRQKQALIRMETFERETGENATFGQEPPFLLADFPRRSSTNEAELIPETPAEELVRIRGYLDELDSDKTKPLPEIYMVDRAALYNFLRLRQKKLPAGKSGQLKFEKIATGMNILLNAKGDNIGTTFWRSWFIGEIRKREHVLAARLKRAERYQADRDELKIIGNALAGTDFELMKGTAQELSGGQRSIKLSNWIKMQAVPLDFLKRLRGAGKNDISPESIQLQQAQKLVKLHRDAKSRVQMRIPGPDRIDETIGNKLKTAQNYKSSKIATIETMHQLKLTWEKRNPLVPLGISEGATLGELVKATDLRIAVARAAMELDGLVAERETAKKEIARLKQLRISQERMASVRQLELRKDTLARELKTADLRLVETMRELYLAAEPDMIPKKTQEK